MTPLNADSPMVRPNAARLDVRLASGQTSMAQDSIDEALAAAFYPFAKVVLRETRRQVQATQEFIEQQSLRREEHTQGRQALMDYGLGLRAELQDQTVGLPLADQAAKPIDDLPQRLNHERDKASLKTSSADGEQDSSQIDLLG